MEMQTAARKRLAITVIVFAQGAWTMEELNELDLYDTTFGTAQAEIRWDVVAQRLGCHGEYVDRIEDLQPALERCRDHDGPRLIFARTDHQSQPQYPGGYDGQVLRGVLWANCRRNCARRRVARPPAARPRRQQPRLRRPRPALRAAPARHQAPRTHPFFERNRPRR